MSNRAIKKIGAAKELPSPICIIKGRPPIKIYVDENGEDIDFEIVRGQDYYDYDIFIKLDDGNKRRLIANAHWHCSFAEDENLEENERIALEHIYERAVEFTQLVKEAYYQGVEALENFVIDLNQIAKDEMYDYQLARKYTAPYMFKEVDEYVFFDVLI